MDYNHIKNYLEKFKNIIFSKEENIKIISEIIEKNISIKIDPKFIQIKGSTIYIKTSPLIRNEILIKKDKILKDLQGVLNQNNIREIR